MHLNQNISLAKNAQPASPAAIRLTKVRLHFAGSHLAHF